MQLLYESCVDVNGSANTPCAHRPPRIYLLVFKDFLRRVIGNVMPLKFLMRTQPKDYLLIFKIELFEVSVERQVKGICGSA